MSGEFRADGSDPLQRVVFDLKLTLNVLGAVVEAEHAIIVVVPATGSRLRQFGQALDQLGVIAGDIRRRPASAPTSAGGSTISCMRWRNPSSYESFESFRI